jgi:hypothetical protein
LTVADCCFGIDLIRFTIPYTPTGAGAIRLG